MAPKGNKLCSGCATIPWDANDPPFGRSKTQKFVIGTGRKVRNTPNCPLCRLVNLALLEAKLVQGYETYEDTEFAIEWNTPSTVKVGEFDLKPSYTLGYSIRLVVEPGAISESSSTYTRDQTTYESYIPVSSPQIDLARVKQWLRMCLANHQASCNAPLKSDSTRLTNLRVIDVIEKCVVEVQLPILYCALSYVWGGVPNIRLTTSNKHALSQPGSLKNIWRRLPKTIKDAIRLVEGIEERFLWVDALCLVQNDPVDVQHGLDVMDLVYERATMTIVAACCAHADHGLSGVREASRYVNQRAEEIIPGLALAVHCDLDHLLRQSMYHKRAWT
jgi:hypothetical protein